MEETLKKIRTLQKVQKEIIIRSIGHVEWVHYHLFLTSEGQIDMKERKNVSKGALFPNFDSATFLVIPRFSARYDPTNGN